MNKRISRARPAMIGLVPMPSRGLKANRSALGPSVWRGHVNSVHRFRVGALPAPGGVPTGASLRVDPRGRMAAIQRDVTKSFGRVRGCFTPRTTCVGRATTIGMIS